MEEFGKDGRVAWVYRHFPLDSIHSKSRNEAQASECAARLGGGAKFWEYLDELFKVTPSNNGLDPKELPKIASRIGLDENSFSVCLAGNGDKDKIQADLDDAIASGGQGTPWNILINAKGKKFVINGALPYDAVKEVVLEALK